MRPRLAFALALALDLFGCSRSDRAAKRAAGSAPADDARAPGSCAEGTTERLGVPFLRVCPRSLAGAEAPAPYWISAVPIACAKGSHDTVRCPPVVSFAELPPDDAGHSRGASSLLAAVVEADTAHKICTMRFGGRLPTRAERALALESLGLATVLVLDSLEVGGARLRQLAEWVTIAPSDHPTLLSPDAGLGRFPAEASAVIPWKRAMSCAPTTVAQGGARREVIGVDGDCPASEWSHDAGRERDLPCLVGVPRAEGDARPQRAFALRCDAPGPPPANASDSVETVAAFRCVLAQGP